MTARMKNLDRVLSRLSKLPDAVKEAAGRQLETEVADLVAAMKRAAPDDPETGGNRIRDGIEAYDNPSRPLSKRVISGARDDKGTFIAPKVEHGHRNADGSHTPARPSFFPTYRARRKGIRRRMSAAARKALKTLYPG